MLILKKIFFKPQFQLLPMHESLMITRLLFFFLLKY